jgi:carboxymethylenebutenolidase
MVRFECPGGTLAKGYYAAPESAEAGVIVLQEWWGLNPQIKSIVDRFAAAGYAAIAPDLYRGRVTDDANEANHLMEGLDWNGAVEIEIAGALAFLKSAAKRVGVTGFCMGGALSILAGTRLPACDAVVAFYGIPPLTELPSAGLRVPLLGHFAKRDAWFPPKAVEAFAEHVGSGAAPFELHHYDAEHAFCNETAAAYDPDAAKAAWSRTDRFLAAHLRPQTAI